MAYRYENEKAAIFTEEGQKMFLAIRDNVKNLLRLAGSVRMDKATDAVTGMGWQMMACVDRMVELGELIELTDSNKVWAQHRVFIEGER